MFQKSVINFSENFHELSVFGNNPHDAFYKIGQFFGLQTFENKTENCDIWPKMNKNVVFSKTLR